MEKLNELKALGIDTIVDPTVWGLGRYIPRVQRVAEQTDLNIIVATGLYTYDEVPHQYEYRGPGLLLDQPGDPMVDDFTQDIRDGIADTGVKAAFLKCVVEAKGLTPGVTRILRACAATHRATMRSRKAGASTMRACSTRRAPIRRRCAFTCRRDIGETCLKPSRFLI